MVLRGKILSAIWEKEEESVKFKNYPKGTPKHEVHQELIKSMKSDFWGKAKRAVLEKYLTLCKNSHLDNVMQWRLRLLACRFTRHEYITIKIRLGMVRSGAAS
jgi:hypothetical protein